MNWNLSAQYNEGAAITMLSSQKSTKVIKYHWRQTIVFKLWSFDVTMAQDNWCTQLCTPIISRPTWVLPSSTALIWTLWNFCKLNKKSPAFFKCLKVQSLHSCMRFLSNCFSLIGKQQEDTVRPLSASDKSIQTAHFREIIHKLAPPF